MRLASRLLPPARIRHLQKTFHRLKLTLLCGFLTVLVLRGTLGAGKFGTPSTDLEEIRHQLHKVHPGWTTRHTASARVLAEVVEQKDRPPRDVELHAEAVDGGSTQRSDGGAYSLGPKITDWDAQRREWMSRVGITAPGGASSEKKPRIMLITGSQPTACENPVGDHYLLKSIKNKIDYCRLHGIEIFYNLAHLDPEMSGFWAKLPLLRKMMVTHPNIEWFWWMDSDAMFTDMVFELPMEKYAPYNMVLHGWDEMVYGQKNWIGLNTGSFLLRNCQWSLDMLDVWAPMGPAGTVRDEAGKLLSRTLRGRPDFEADDQSALVYLLATQREKWGEKVFLESSYYLHGYWMILVDKYEEMMEKYRPGFGDDRWPFVTHFVGCKPCKKVEDDSARACLKQMERAFNFADNQVLQMYGFHHKSLSSSKVKPIRNKTDRPLEVVDELNLLQRRKQKSPNSLG